MSTLLSIKSTVSTFVAAGFIAAAPLGTVYACSQPSSAHSSSYGHSQKEDHSSESHSSHKDSDSSHSEHETVKTSYKQDKDEHKESSEHENEHEHQSTPAKTETHKSDDASEHAKGNNGTIKIHEAGTPDGTENNDPKVCSFNVEGFGFDAGQTGYLKFDVQGGDKPTGTAQGPYSFGATNANGFYASQYFKLADGHYKATLYGKMLPSGQLSDVKAKSKVFKVSCGTVAPTTSNTGKGSDKVTPATDQNGKVLTATTEAAQLANTGQMIWVSSVLGALVAVAAVATTLRKKVQK